MAERWTAPGGWVVQLEADGHGRQVYRVTRWGGWFLAFPRELAALEAMLARSGVAVADLVEDPGLPPWAGQNQEHLMLQGR